MTELLSRLFVKNYRNTSDPNTRRSYGTMASVVGIIMNLLLFAGKFTVGTLAGAISITADGFNNLSDAGSQIISLLSFRMSARPADRKHPFGHARIEYVASMIVSFLILNVGIDLLSDSIGKLIHPEPPAIESKAATICVLAAAIAVKLWLGLFNRKLGKKIDSDVMRATAADSLSDALSTTAVLIGTVLYMLFSWVWIDAVMGIAVALMICWAGISILNETKNRILGEGPSEEIIKNIVNIVKQYPESLGIHDMIVHNYGPGRTIVSLHVEVDGKKDIFELHDVIDCIEKRLDTDLGIEATIHMDPIVTDDEQVNSLRKAISDAVRNVDSRLKTHDFRFVKGTSHSNIIFDIAVPFEVGMSDEQVKNATENEIKKMDPCFNTVITIDRQ